jgi:hypothetical protein
VDPSLRAVTEKTAATIFAATLRLFRRFGRLGHLAFLALAASTLLALAGRIEGVHREHTVKPNGERIVALDNVHCKGNAHLFFHNDNLEGHFRLVVAIGVCHSNHLIIIVIKMMMMIIVANAKQENTTAKQ